MLKGMTFACVNDSIWVGGDGTEVGGGCNGMLVVAVCLCGCVVGVHLSMGGAEEWDIAIAKEKIRDCFGDHTAEF